MSDGLVAVVLLIAAGRSTGIDRRVTLAVVIGADPVRPASCPECAASLVGAGAEPPWCPECEWNLGVLPASRSGRQWRLRRRLDGLAFAVDRRLFADLAGALPNRPRWSLGLLTVMVISVLLGAATLALLVVGVVLIVTATWPAKVLGLLLVGVSFELRPRLPGVDATSGYRTRAELPALFRGIDSIAAQIGSPSVNVVVVEGTFDASCARYGLRRRRVLVLGLPLWASLSPAGRVALLGHQLAHLVDGDPEQYLLTQPALATFGNLADAFARRGRVLPDEEIRGGEDGEVTAAEYVAMMGTPGYQSGRPARNSFESMAGASSALLFKPLNWLCTAAHRALRALTAHSRQRAEYYADALALDVAGTAGVIEYCQTLLLNEPVFVTARRWLRVGAAPATVHVEAADTIARYDADLRRREQHSMRTESSLFAGHPPTGRRLRMLRTWPTAEGRLSSDALDFAAIDAQLEPDYRRVARTLTHVP